MLQHLPTPTDQTPPPAQTRVRPEELAQALAAIEARREQSAREAAGTIPIGEAVQQLGFDATPEEVWTEVQAQRVKRVRPTPRASRNGTAWLVGTTFAVLVLGGLGHEWLCPDSSPPQPPSQLVAPPPVKQPGVMNQNISVMEHTPGGPLVELLSEVPEGHPVLCSYDDASKITPGYLARSDGSPSPQPGYSNSVRWTLIKHDGKVYLRGWSRNRVSNGALNVVEMTLYSKRSIAGVSAVPVTLRLGSFDSDISQGSYGAGDDAEAIRVTDIYPDGHLWEKP